MMPTLSTLVQAQSLEEVKREVINFVHSLSSAEAKSLNGIYELSKELLSSKEAQRENIVSPEEKMKVALLEYFKLTAIENGSYLASNVHPTDIDKAQHTREALIQEHNAVSLTEKMIIDTVVSAYLRYHQASNLYSNILEDSNGKVRLGVEESTDTLKELRHIIDISNKQFIANITFLKELKRPKINIRVNSQQTFVAQNQQVNQTA